MSFASLKVIDQLPITGFDSLAGAIRELPQLEPDVTHRFTPGLYSRELKLPKGSVNVSKIHKSEHQFAIAKGHVEVWSKDTGSVHYVAPHIGITKPGTQRAVYAHEDTTWLTFHPTTETDIAKIEEDIIQKPDDESVTISDEAFNKLCPNTARLDEPIWDSRNSDEPGIARGKIGG